MSIEFTDEQQAFVAAIRDFSKRECGTREQRDILTNHGADANSMEMCKKIAELGWTGVGIKEEYGGLGGGAVDMCLFLDESQRGLLPVGSIGPTWIVAAAYDKFGSEQQKHEILGGIANGAVEAIAMSEPGAGSDVGALQCKAEKVEGGYRINGHKTWISNGHIADHILLVARTDASGQKHEGLTMLNVPTAGTEGLTVRGIPTMGGKEVNDVFFDDVFVADDALVGLENGAWVQLMAGLNIERLIIGAMMLGRAQRVFDDIIEYVTQRKQFGRPIGSFQAVKHRIADLATELECARLLTYATAQKVDANPTKMFPREASMVKLKCTELAKQISIEGMQMFGGYGYATEYDMEGHLRATVVSTVYGGANEIQRDIIGKTYGL